MRHCLLSFGSELYSDAYVSNQRAFFQLYVIRIRIDIFILFVSLLFFLEFLYKVSTTPTKTGPNMRQKYRMK